MNVENILSIVAIVISLLSLGISLYIGHLEEKPYICLKAITFNKKHFKIKNIPKNCRKVLKI